MSLDYGDYVRTWRAGHFDTEQFLGAEAWGHMQLDMRAVTINVLEHQQRILADRARQAARDRPATPADVW